MWRPRQEGFGRKYNPQRHPQYHTYFLPQLGRQSDHVSGIFVHNTELLTVPGANVPD